MMPRHCSIALTGSARSLYVTSAASPFFTYALT